MPFKMSWACRLKQLTVTAHELFKYSGGLIVETIFASAICGGEDLFSGGLTFGRACYQNFTVLVNARFKSIKISDYRHRPRAAVPIFGSSVLKGTMGNCGRCSQ